MKRGLGVLLVLVVLAVIVVIEVIIFRKLRWL